MTEGQGWVNLGEWERGKNKYVCVCVIIWGWTGMPVPLWCVW